jgi:uncharacterized Fe-S cluster protein YjdI
MSMYLSNTDLHATGSETVEFLDEPEPVPFGATPPSRLRTYVSEGITVYWDADRCWHSERCTTGVPAVFDKTARPWVDPDGAPADDIARVIDTCPSGALSYTRTDGAPHGRRGRAADEDPTAATAADDTTGVAADAGDGEVLVTIRPQANGPLEVVGPVALVRPDGETEIAHRLTLCRCGHSAAKPRCDGSHARVGFQAPGAP